MSDPKAAQHFLYLDLIRGIAAFSVLIYHLEEAAAHSNLFSGSFLAVDLFFLMSGFVLTRAYEAKLQSGALGFMAFVKVRVLRLYPLYAAALVIGVGYYLLKTLVVTSESVPVDDLLRTVPPALLLLPNPFETPAIAGAYPLVGTAWSLSLELWFNFLYAAIAFRLPNKVLIGLTAVAGIAMAVLAVDAHSFDMGWGWSTMLGGIARFWFSFTLGILFYRGRLFITGQTWLALLLIPLGLAYMAVGHSNLWAQALYIYVLFPLTLVVYANRQPPAWLRAISDHAGRLSYGIYVLQTPLFLFVVGFLRKLTGRDPLAFSFAHWLLVLAVITAASAVIIYGFDEPFRRLFSSKRRARRLDSVTSN